MLAKLAKPKSGVTHAQIAEAVGVSRALVTHALHGSRGGRVSDSTREEILAAARRLGYRPRNVATYNIAMIASTGGLKNQEDFNLFLNVEREVRNRGYRLMLVNSDDLQARGALQQILNPKTVDGVLLTEATLGGQPYSLAPEIPQVLLSEEPVGPATDQVAVDLKTTASNILAYLRAKGHTRVAFVGGVPEGGFHSRMQRAAQSAAKELGWPAGCLTTVEATPPDVAEHLLKAMLRPEPPTALVAADTYRAFPAYGALLGAGYLIPEVVSLVAFFDSMYWTYLGPKITSTSALGTCHATAAAARLVDRIEDPDLVPCHTFVAGEVIERESVAELAPCHPAC